MALPRIPVCTRLYVVGGLGFRVWFHPKYWEITSHKFSDGVRITDILFLSIHTGGD